MERPGPIRVALVYPPYANSKFVLFSLAYLVNDLRRQNPCAEFKIFNCPAEGYSLEELFLELGKYQPDIVGVSLPFTLMLKSALRIIDACKRLFPKAWIVAGGMHATLCPEDLYRECDYVVIGDGRRPMTQIIRSFLAKQKSYEIPGVAFAENSKMVIIPREKEDAKLSRMGSPDWGDMDLSPFIQPVIFGDQRKGFPVFTSAGCPFDCSYCSNYILSDRKVTYRDLNEVISEIQWLQKKYNIGLFTIADEVFTLDKDRVVEFCEMIEKKKLNIIWIVQTRASLVPDKDILIKMKNSGARVISLGIESGNSDVLKFNKGISRDQVVNAANLIKKLGFLVYAGFIIGFPQDTIDTVWDTIRFPDELDLDSPGFQLMVPYPKTKVREIAEKDGGILTNDFDKYTTYGVVYLPPGLKGYDMLAIRRFAYQYFHTRSRKRLDNWLKRFVGTPDFGSIKEKFTSIYEQKDKYNKEYLMSLKYSRDSIGDQKIERLPI